ncbi:MAG TPA: hypothetical protein VIJ66_04840 [Solirubrobacteraceae bacterium]
MRIMFIKWLKLKRKSKSEQNPDPEPEPKSALRPPPITSMMVPEPGAVIGGKRRK